MDAAPQPSLQSTPTANGWRDLLKVNWTALAQRTGHALLSEDRLDAFASRLCKVTSHATSDLSSVVFLGLKMKVQTVAELVVDFVVEEPGTPLPEKLDVLQLLENSVDRKFDAYLQHFSVLPSDEQHCANNVFVHRRGFEECHMEAALRAKLRVNDVNGLEPKPIFSENNMDRFQNIASGEERVYFVESLINGKPTFVDSVYADYFAAKWLSVHFSANAAFLGERLYSSRHTVLRYLLDRFLARGRDLHVAVLHDDLLGVRRLLEVEGVDADQRDNAGRTALHLAAARNVRSPKANEMWEILGLSITHTKDIDALDDLFGGSPLFYADKCSSWKVIDKLLRSNADPQHLPTITANLTSAAMLKAIFKDDLDQLMAFCLDKGLPVEFQTPGTQRIRLLARACGYQSLRVAMLLIHRGANINGVAGDSGTPLCLACDEGHLEMARYLVETAKQAAHLDPSQLAPSFVNDNSCGYTALHCAVEHEDVVEFLLAEGADPWVRDSESGQTPLHYAIEMDMTNTASMLIDAVDAAKRVDYVNAVDNLGLSPIQKATDEGVQLLCNAGAHMTKSSLLSILMPLIVAGNLSGLQTIFTIFDSMDVQLNLDHLASRDDEGMSALHWAAIEGHADIVAFLIGQGAQVDCLDKAGKSPLIYAIEHGNEDCVDILRGAGL